MEPWYINWYRSWYKQTGITLPQFFFTMWLIFLTVGSLLSVRELRRWRSFFIPSLALWPIVWLFACILQFCFTPLSWVKWISNGLVILVNSKQASNKLPTRRRCLTEVTKLCGPTNTNGDTDGHLVCQIGVTWVMWDFCRGFGCGTRWTLSYPLKDDNRVGQVSWKECRTFGCGTSWSLSNPPKDDNIHGWPRVFLEGM